MSVALALLSGLAGCGLGTGQKPLLRLADTGMSEASFEEGKQLLDRGSATEAVTAFRAVLRRDGPGLPVLNGLAIAYAELGRPAQAADMFSRALAIAPDDPATLNNVGFAALRRADTLLARLYLERAKRVGGGVGKIGGNLAQLARLEARTRLVPALSGSDRSEREAMSPLSVERLTTSVLQLLGLQAEGPVAPIAAPATFGYPKKAAAMLIDFTQVVDPWARRKTGDES